MTSHQLDLTPRKIWLGLTIPGKKMMRILEPGGSVDTTIDVVRRNGGLAGQGAVPGRPFKEMAEKHRGRKLIHMYQIHLWVALHFAALALHFYLLHAVPTQGARYGPSRRLWVKLYGSILTDVRDFLKLRFRTKGRVDPDEKVPPHVRWALENGNMEHVTQTDDPKYVFGYLVDSVISELDNLSKSPNTVADNSILRLRNVLSGMVGLVYAYQSDADTLEEMFDERNT